MVIEFIIFFITLILFTILWHRKPKGMPPGEWGLPVVGYIPFVNWKLSETLLKLEQKHGKIYSLKLGVRTFIIITDYSLIKEAYNRTEITARPFFFSYDILKKFSSLGLITCTHPVWETNRRFALKTLKDFGLGKSRLEEFVHTEAEYLVQELKKNVDKPFKIDWNLNVAVLNVIWRLVANRRYNINDKEIKEFSQYSTENMEDVEGPITLINLFPWILPLLPKFLIKSWMRIDSVEEKRTKIFNFFTDLIEEHKKTVVLGDPRDYIDAYLTEMEAQKDNPDYAHWGDSDLLTSVYDFFLAGSDTTSTTLRWFFLYMTKNPNVQKRVQKEIDSVLPRDKLPSMQDKDRLPCLEALSYEINRVISLVPQSLSHVVTKDTTLDGYFIPKGAWVVPNTESIHKNPKYWDHPNEFSLENFLNSEGKFQPKKEGYMPFSIGRRQCLGEILAKMEIFLFIGAILQNFDILEPEGENISLISDENVNIFNYPLKFNILLKIRE